MRPAAARRRRRLAIHLCELVALVATAAAVIVLVGGGSDGSSRSDRAATRSRPHPEALDPKGDADHDGVPNGKDLQPRVPGAAKPEHIAAPSLPAPPRPDCKRKGITRKGTIEGECVDTDGHRIHVVNRGSTLDLRELAVTVDSIELRRSVGQGRDRLPARGHFVVMTLTVRNDMRDVEEIRPEELVLLLGFRAYAHDPTAESVVPKSFSWTGGVITPGRERTGQVIFQVHGRKPLKRLDKDGTLLVLQFSDLDYDTAARTIGYIRTRS